MIDFSSDFGKKAERRLKEEQVIWLTTAAPDGTPQPNPVWFLWEGNSILIFTQPNSIKLRNIARNPKVALNLNATPDGGDVVVLTGEAVIAKDSPPASQVDAYMKKYREGISDINMTSVSFSQGYSVAIRVTPSRLRGF